MLFMLGIETHEFGLHGVIFSGFKFFY
jgi:hypothetical protein